MKAIIEKTTKLESIMYPVRKESIKDILGMEANPHCVDAIIGTINGNDSLLATCGERYNLISNQELLAPILLLLAGYEYEIDITIRNRSTFEIKINITDKRLAVSVGNSKDLIFPSIGINRSYDGKSPYFVYAGYFRMVCKNGVIVPLENSVYASIKGKHTEKFSETIAKINSVVEKIVKDVEKTSKDTKKRFEVLYDTKVENYADRVVEVMSAVGLKPIKSGTLNGVDWERTDNLDHVLASIRTEMAVLEEDQVNDWLIYNGINAYIYDNDANVKSDEIRKTTDRKVYDYLVKN